MPQTDRCKIAFVPVEERGSLAFPIPRILRSSRARPKSRRAVQSCPAVNAFERRVIEVLAPFSLRLRCRRNANGRFDVHVVDDGTRIDADLITRVVSVMPREIWRSDSYPVVQIALPHIFVSDDEVFLTQMAAWASSNAARIPGMLIGGRYPVHIWPRSLNLAFEWTNFNEDFVIRRGQPICYMFAETKHFDDSVELIEAEMTPELSSYLSKISDVVKYTSGSFDLFDRALEVRPKILVKEISHE